MNALWQAGSARIQGDNHEVDRPCAQPGRRPHEVRSAKNRQEMQMAILQQI
jgi:hypothetical protein